MRQIRVSTGVYRYETAKGYSYRVMFNGNQVGTFSTLEKAILEHERAKNSGRFAKKHYKSAKANYSSNDEKIAETCLLGVLFSKCLAETRQKTV